MAELRGRPSGKRVIGLRWRSGGRKTNSNITSNQNWHLDRNRHVSPSSIYGLKQSENKEIEEERNGLPKNM